MFSVRLPVAGVTVVLRAPTGVDDVFLLAQPRSGTGVAAAFLARIATHEDGSPLDCARLSLTDVDAALLQLRRALLGDLLRTAVRCSAGDCGALFDVSFRISDYLRHHLPRKARASATEEPGWFRLDRSETLFRLPTAGDLVALAQEPEPERALALRCIRPHATRAVQRRVEAAMAALAPSLYGQLDSSCHECGRSVPLFFNPSSYVLEELARRAASVYEEVHALALSYHWSESDILALPRERRQRYAELAYAEARRA